MKKDKINLVEPAEKSFILEFTDRLKYLQSYLNDRYKPLKSEIYVSKVENRPYILGRCRLVGENLWSVGVEVNVSEQLHMALDQSYLIQKYVDELKHRIEDAVVKEGIKSINQ